MTTCTEKCPRHTPAAAIGTFEALARKFRAWTAARRLQARIARERRQLRDLPDELLRDIGVSRGDAERESRRADIPWFRLGS